MPTAGPLYAWGANHTGLLGRGPGDDISTPVKVEDLPPIIDVAAGQLHVLALTPEGEVWSWGWDTDCNLLGQPDADGDDPWLTTWHRRNGMGHTMERLSSDAGVLRPRPVRELPPVRQIAANSGNSFVLTETGEVWVWGSAAGLGKKARNNQPSPVRIEALSDIVEIAMAPAGEAFYARDALGQVWSWGNGHEGELGHGKRRFQAVPEIIPGLNDIESIIAGEFHCWFKTRSGDLLFCGNGQGLNIQQRNSLRIREPKLIDTYGHNLEVHLRLFPRRSGPCTGTGTCRHL